MRHLGNSASLFRNSAIVTLNNSYPHTAVSTVFILASEEIFPMKTADCVVCETSLPHIIAQGTPLVINPNSTPVCMCHACCWLGYGPVTDWMKQCEHSSTDVDKCLSGSRVHYCTSLWLLLEKLLWHNTSCLCSRKENEKENSQRSAKKVSLIQTLQPAQPTDYTQVGDKCLSFKHLNATSGLAL